jgi:hypothetical protein
MRIGILVALAVFAIACTTSSGVSSAAGTGGAAAVVVAGEPASGAAATGPSSLKQALVGRATPKNAADTADISRKWEFVLFASPTSGQPGIAKVTVDATFAKHKEKKTPPATAIPADPRCSAPMQWGADLSSLTWTQSYQDAAGSTLEGKAKNPASQAVCTDGNAFQIKVEGDITKGKGMFKNVKGGDWKATIDVSEICNPVEKWCPVKGKFEATNLTYQ